MQFYVKKKQLKNINFPAAGVHKYTIYHHTIMFFLFFCHLMGLDIISKIRKNKNYVNKSVKFWTLHVKNQFKTVKNCKIVFLQRKTIEKEILLQFKKYNKNHKTMFVFICYINKMCYSKKAIIKYFRVKLHVLSNTAV